MSDALQDLVSQDPALWNAEALAVDACMRRYGLRYAGALQLRDEDVPARRSLAGVPRPIPPHYASEHGYGPFIADDDPLVAAAESYVAELPPARRQLYAEMLENQDGSSVGIELDGVPTVYASNAGCLAEGRTAIYGSVGKWLAITRLADGLLQFGDEALRSAPVLRAADKYALCMSQHGYTFANPAVTRKYARSEFGAFRDPYDPPGERERSIAIADAHCQDKTGIYEMIDRMTVASGSEWVAKYQHEILAAVNQKRAMMRRVDREP